jgi:protein-disulfide isomerase
VVVEFADFQCDSCQRHSLETQPIVDERFVETGEILWVFKHLPLKIHPQSPAAAAAAECAGDQGQFWQMHDLLFETLEEWSTAKVPDATFLALAEELELDAGVFQTCLNSRQALERVLSDIYDAQGVVDRTPTFIFLFGGRGSASRGALPTDQFISRLEGLLEQAKASE